MGNIHIQCTCTYVYKYGIRIHVHVYIYMYNVMYMYMYMYVHVYICTCTCTCIYMSRCVYQATADPKNLTTPPRVIGLEGTIHHNVTQLNQLHVHATYMYIHVHLHVLRVYYYTCANVQERLTSLLATLFIMILSGRSMVLATASTTSLA